MKALVARTLTPEWDMTIEERPVPVPPAGRSLIRMRAATVNQLSNTIRTGQWGVHGPLILGNEGVGSVEQSSTFARGTRVAIYGGGEIGISEDGLFQEFVVLEDDRLVELPAEVSDDFGSVLTVNYLTAYRALTKVAGVHADQIVLVTGASGSVGNAVVQIATALGARAIAVVSTSEKAQRAIESGAWQAIDLSAESLVDAVGRHTGTRGVDVAFDPVGGERFGQALDCLSDGGLLVSLGFTGGKTPPVEIPQIVARELKIEGYALHAEQRVELMEALRTLVALLQGGRVKPLIDSRFPLSRVEDAYARLTSRRAVGSIILDIASNHQEHK